MGHKKRILSLLALLGPALIGCSQHAQPKLPPQTGLVSAVAPTSPPSASPANPTDTYIQKRVELDWRDKEIAARLTRVLADLNSGLSGTNRSLALKSAGGMATPILNDATALAKDYQMLDAPDSVKNFDSASAEAEGDVVDAIKTLRDAMLSGDPTQYNDAVDGLSVAAQDATLQVDEGLRRDGYDPDVWKGRHKLVKSRNSVRTGL